MNLKDISISKLVKELQNRQGVNTITVDPYENYYITTEKLKAASSGPTVILEIID